jgi:hypothetical protein
MKKLVVYQTEPENKVGMVAIGVLVLLLLAILDMNYKIEIVL